MKRSTRTVLATSAALALTAFGAAAPASATNEPSKPKPGAWEKFDDTYYLKAGDACSKPVVARDRGAQRVTELGDGKVFVEFADWSHVTFAAKKNHHKKVVLNYPSGGDLYAKGSGDTLYIKADGWNWNQGKGVKGIVVTKGKVSFGIDNFTDEDFANDRVVNFNLHHAKKVVQVCYKLGSKPVWGKNVEPKSA